MYVELHAHSAFSFLDGASTPMELAAAAAAHGYPAFALTDHDGLWGSMEFAHACRGFGVRGITGAELTVRLRPAGPVSDRGLSPPGESSRSSPPAGGDVHITLLVEDAVGYRNLCRLLTLAHAHTRDNNPRRQMQPWATLEQVEEHAEGLVCLSGCAGDGAVAGAFERGDTAEGERLARRLLAAFGRDRFRIELQRPYWRRDRARNRWLALLAERLDVPCLATGNVHSHDRRRAPAQDALVAIGLCETLEESEPRRRGNSTSALTSPGAMAARFAEYPEAVVETERIAERLRFDLTAQLGYPTPAARTRGPTPSSPASATTTSASATAATPACWRHSGGWRRSWRSSASSASPASSSSTATCWSWRARSPPRCAGRSRRAPSCHRGGDAAPASARSSAPSPASPTSIRSRPISSLAASSTRKRPRCRTSTSTSRGTSARC